MKKVFTLLLVVLSLTVVSCDDTVKATSNTKTSATAQGSIKHVNPQAFKKAIDAKTGVVVDVRTPGEYAQGHLKGAKNIDAMNGAFAKEFAKLDKKTPVLIYCKSGGRSGRAAQKLKRMGFTVYNMQGGIMGWSRQGLPLN
jgi:rhodanese-related sulfurtransferase